MAKRHETHGRFCAARLSYFALFEEDNAGPDLRKGRAGGCISALENLHLIEVRSKVRSAGDGFCCRFHGWAGRPLLAFHFCPSFPLRVRDRTACFRAELAARFLLAVVGVMADFLAGLAWLPSVRSARACLSLSISSSRAFTIWSFKDGPFRAGGGHKNDDAPWRKDSSFSFPGTTRPVLVST